MPQPSAAIQRRNVWRCCLPDYSTLCIPTLVAPTEGTLMDNGRLDGTDSIVWDFDWSDCAEATEYHLYVRNADASVPEVDGLLLICPHTSTLARAVTFRQQSAGLEMESGVK